MYMPAGTHSITPSQNGRAVRVEVFVDASAAAALESQRASLAAKGKKPYFDFNHEDREASFWPVQFFWKDSPAPGVYARGEWTDLGETGIKGKRWRQFSPVFHVDSVTATPSRIVSHDYAKPNMGGLVNNAAFTDISPLWGKEHASPALDKNTNQKDTMKPAIEIVASAPRDIMNTYAGLVAKNAALPLTAESAHRKSELALEAAAIFAAEMTGSPAFLSMPMHEAVKAADYSDPQNHLGVLSGTLALQRTLDLFRYEFPFLGAICTDHSATPGRLFQTENTRIQIEPAVQNYDPSVDSAGRPKGWVNVSPAQTVDVPVTLDEYVGVPIVHGVATMAATVRNLFEEVAPMAMYAIAKRFVSKLTGLFTPANFNAYKAASVTGGETTEDNATIVVSSTEAMYPGQPVAGAGIPANTFVRSITDATHAVLNNAATATASGLTFTLGNGKVPTLYPTFVKALADFDLASLDLVAGAFDTHEVPQQNRFALLNAQYYRRLRQDPTLNMFFAAIQQPEIITKGRLPELTGFMPYNAPYLPTANNLVGFAGHRSAAVLKTRLPNDLNTALGSATMIPGQVTTVTDSATNLSMLLVQYIDLKSNYAEWRPEVLLGSAVGDRRGGICITNQ